LIRDIYRKPTVLSDCETLGASPENRTQSTMSAIVTSVQLELQILAWWQLDNKKKQMRSIWEGRIKTISICRCHGPEYGKS
jgi:hypothetical protein